MGGASDRLRGLASEPHARRHLLVIDDDVDQLAVMRALLERGGYRVTTSSDPVAGIEAVAAHRPDLVILDVRMPRLDGWRALEQIRLLSDVPVLMLTVRGEELEKVRGLRAGADDYVAKPFGRQELLARIEAVLRRALPPTVEPVYTDDTLSVDFARSTVTVRGREVPLTPVEFRLLATFVRHREELLSRERLCELVWGRNSVGAGDVRTYVSYVRRKLLPARPIETVHGFGYRYRG